MSVGFHLSKAEPGSALAYSRMAAHAAFDPIWKDGHMLRSEAYRWLADRLGITKGECHIVNFDDRTCRKVTLLCDEFMFRMHADAPLDDAEDLEAIYGWGGQDWNHK